MRAAAVAILHRRHQDEPLLFGGKLGAACGVAESEGASLRRANAAQVCSNVFLVGGYGQHECSPAISGKADSE